MKYSIYLLMAFACIVTYAGCDSPKPTHTGGEKKPQLARTTPEKPDPAEGIQITKNRRSRREETPPCSFAFATKDEDHKVAYTARGSYPYPVAEGNTCAIAYSSSNDDIATVDKAGKVTFKTAGTVTITARKEKEGEHEKVEDSYTLYITMKPANKNELVQEIKKAMAAHGEKVDLNYIDTSAVTDMSELFSLHKGAYGLSAFAGNISKWDVSKVKYMNNMFWGARAFNSDISGWKVNKVTNMSYMFDGARAFNSDISGWKVNKVTDMAYMFNGARAFNSDISGWKVNKVTDMRYMFKSATSFNSDISKWDVSAVEYMDHMFDGATAFNSDISRWDVSKVFFMNHMFFRATVFNSDISGWKVKNVENMRYMFFRARAFNQNLNAWGSRLHDKIKEKNFRKALSMFTKSLPTHYLPDWCNKNRACRERAKHTDA